MNRTPPPHVQELLKRVGVESETRVPMDLRKALAAAPAVMAAWKDLTPIARRDFVSWIDSAREPACVAEATSARRRPEARRQRVEKACATLAAGKRRP